MQRTIKIIGVSTGLALILAVAAWFFFFRPAPQAPQEGTGQNFLPSNAGNTTVGVAPQQNGGTSGTNTPTPAAQQQKIFKIADGPVAGALFIQSGTPTTTLARYVMADSGHVLDLAVDVSGAAPRPVSNTTIPGIVETAWGEKGTGALLRYVDEGIVKTIYIGLSRIATSTRAVQPTRVQFLPDAIPSLAMSPDGKTVAYLLTTPEGTDGYLAALGGAGSKVFSLPLRQVRITWPAHNIVLAQSAPAAGVPGIAFSINTKGGAVSQLVYADGLSAIANAAFSHVLYTTVGGSGTSRSSYAHNTQTGRDIPLSFQPFPEKCAWSRTRSTYVYCAVPLSAPVSPDYLDKWHQGTASAADSILQFNVANGKVTILGTPGTQDGGVPADIAELSVSPDDQYVLFIAKGTRSLWGLRLR